MNLLTKHIRIKIILPKVHKHPAYQRYTLPDIQFISLPSTNTTIPHWKIQITHNQRTIQKIQKIRLRPTDLLVSFD